MSKSKNESKASQSKIKPQKLNNNPDVRELTNEELDSVSGGFAYFRKR
jgi:bacteriocin-like protein